MLSIKTRELFSSHLYFSWYIEFVLISRSGDGPNHALCVSLLPAQHSKVNTCSLCLFLFSLAICLLLFMFIILPFFFLLSLFLFPLLILWLLVFGFFLLFTFCHSFHNSSLRLFSTIPPLLQLWIIHTRTHGQSYIHTLYLFRIYPIRHF